MSLIVEIETTETEAFEELQPGEYKFQILPPNDPSKAESIFYKTDEAGTPIPGKDGKPEVETRYLNWPLQVMEGSEKGRMFYHRTMVFVSPEKMALSEKTYEPAGFTLRFLDSLGFCDTVNGKLRLKAELWEKNPKTGKTSLRLDKIYGAVFMGRLEKKPYKGKDYVNLTKSWVPKGTTAPKEEELF